MEIVADTRAGRLKSDPLCASQAGRPRIGKLGNDAVLSLSVHSAFSNSKILKLKYSKRRESCLNFERRGEGGGDGYPRPITLWLLASSRLAVALREFAGTARDQKSNVYTTLSCLATSGNLR